jgi:hypothetical protein
MGAAGGGGIHLKAHEIGLVVQGEHLNVFILQDDLVIRIEEGGQGGQPERWKQRILDRAPIRADASGERRRMSLTFMAIGRRRIARSSRVENAAAGRSRVI